MTFQHKETDRSNCGWKSIVDGTEAMKLAQQNTHANHKHTQRRFCVSLAESFWPWPAMRWCLLIQTFGAQWAITINIMVGQDQLNMCHPYLAQFIQHAVCHVWPPEHIKSTHIVDTIPLAGTVTRWLAYDHSKLPGILTGLVHPVCAYGWADFDVMAFVSIYDIKLRTVHFLEMKKIKSQIFVGGKLPKNSKLSDMRWRKLEKYIDR